MKHAIVLCLVSLMLCSANGFAQASKTYKGQKGAIRIELKDMRYDIEVSMKEDSYFIKITNNSEIELGIDLNVEKVLTETRPFTHHINFMSFDFQAFDPARNLKIGKGENFVLDFKRKAGVQKYVVRLELFDRDQLLKNLKSKNVSVRIDNDYIGHHRQVAIFENYKLVRTGYHEISLEFDNGVLPNEAVVTGF